MDLNAFITLLPAAEPRRGPLAGMRMGIKDFYDTAGVRTTAAFEKFMNRVPEKDAVAVAQLKEAGAILVGKTNMHRLGMGTTGLESAFGPVKNPWNADFIPGGSSSGSAAAVASGMCVATLDTDAVGSCRLPAACCGVVAFKPTYGLISTEGILADQPPPDETIRWLSHAAITAKSVRDVMLVFEALTGIAPPTRTNPRLGVAANFEADDEVRAAFQPFAAGLIPTTVPHWEFSRGIANIEHDRKTLTLFDEIDVLLLPTTTTPTPLVREAAGNEQYLSPANTLFANYYGLPAISIPCGVDANGLPIGLQIVGKAHGDWTVLRVAEDTMRAIA